MSRNAVQLILTLFLALFFGATSESRAFVQFAKFVSFGITFASPTVLPVTAATTDGVEYNIYGKILHRTDGRTLHRLGTTNTPFLYVGQFGIQTDPNGLHHMRTRYYNPHLMRFLNADPIGFAGGSNWYSYAGNSPPLLFIDPTGLCPSSGNGGENCLDAGSGQRQRGSIDVGFASLSKTRLSTFELITGKDYS
jgi:RHS repeat-associated protein